MKTIASKFFLLILGTCFFPTLGLAQNPQQLFTQGNEAYEKDNFPLAISLYKAALNYEQSEALHYNLANAYFKNADPGRAILHYQKALLINPRDPEIRTNLQFVKNQLEIPQEPHYFFKALTYWASYNQWLMLCAVSFWISILFIIYIKWYQAPRLFTGLGLMLTGVIFLISLYTSYHLQKTTHQGVILDADTQLKVAPTENSPNIAFIQAGHNVNILKEQDKHYFIKYPFNNKEGWVLIQNCQPIWNTSFK